MGPIAFALVALSAAPGKHFVFGAPNVEWIVMSDAGAVERRLKQIHGFEPLDAALSPDGKRWAVVATNASGKRFLHLFDDGGEQVRTVTTDGEVLDGVQFSPDGEWVYFSANEFNQPRFDAHAMLFAQVYRVRFAQGEPERVSLSRGCHMWPKPINSANAVVSHATCVGGRSLAVLNAKTGREVDLVSTSEDVGETAVTSDGKRVFFSTVVPAGYQFSAMELRPGAARKVWKTMRFDSARARPAWAADDKSVLIQNGVSILRLRDDGTLEQLATLENRS